MTHESGYLIEQSKYCQLLYNPELLEKPAASFLKDEILHQAEQVQQISNGGRGQAWFVQMDSLSGVLRAYQRGGLVARFNQQSYFGLSAESSRAFREWRILQWMLDNGLPVPRPVAASVCRWPCSFSPLYRAHILVERIANALTFDQLLSEQVLEHKVWSSIGQCIARFHHKGIYHADLNANNILLDNKYSVYLIDFDKAEIRQAHSQQIVGKALQWKRDNLLRLKRSLLKQREIHPDYNYSEAAWEQLMKAYENFTPR